MAYTEQPFGTGPDGQPVTQYSLTNDRGSRADFIPFGASLTALRIAADGDGEPVDVVLGFDDLQSYLDHTAFIGCVVGRYANRIGQARYVLDGVPYALTPNHGAHQLHGGPHGLHRTWWTTEPVAAMAGPALRLRAVCPDGLDGHPGNLEVEVQYTLTQTEELVIECSATTDRPTVCNLSHHHYFNLAGHGDVLDHELWINAERFTPTDEEQIPTGELRPVAGTPFDFTRPAPIGARIGDADPQLRCGRGYDHNWVLHKSAPGAFEHAARVVEPRAGRVLDVWTTEPGLQGYSGNHLDGGLTGKRGAIYGRHAGLCLETQHFPDSPNHPHFPDTVLRPGETYRSKTVYGFSTR
jgi:aldose 1-epimerase